MSHRYKSLIIIGNITQSSSNQRSHFIFTLHLVIYLSHSVPYATNISFLSEFNFLYFLFRRYPAFKITNTKTQVTSSVGKSNQILLTGNCRCTPLVIFNANYWRFAIDSKANIEYFFRTDLISKLGFWIIWVYGRPDRNTRIIIQIPWDAAATINFSRWAPLTCLWDRSCPLLLIFSSNPWKGWMVI